MTAPMTMTNCPTDPQLLAAFAEGRLRGDERARVIEHLATCAECYDKVEYARAYAAEMGGMGGEVLTPRRGWIVPAVTLAAAAAIGAVVFLGPVGDTIMRPRRIAALTEATASLDKRPIATRPSFDIPYNDFPVYRSGGESSLELALAPAAMPLVKVAEKRPTVENLHAAGVAWLLVKESKVAVRALEDAVKKETAQTDAGQAISASTNADLLNDLAAAYYETGDNKVTVAIARAWQLKQSAPIAWTRATILNSAAGWKDYLAIDSTSEWAKEARTKLDPYASN